MWTSLSSFRFLAAIVKPNGELKVIAQFNLTAGFNFQIGTSGHNDFQFQQTHYRAEVIGITPPCQAIQRHAATDLNCFRKTVYPAVSDGARIYCPLCGK